MNDSSIDPRTYQVTIDPHTKEWIVSEFDLDCIAVGAGILGSGGGGHPHLGNRMAKEKLREGKQIRIMSPERFQARADPHTLAATVVIMGAPYAILQKLGNAYETKLGLNAVDALLQIPGDKAEYLIQHGCKVEKSDCVTGCGNLPASLADNVPKKRLISALMGFETGGLNSVQPLVLAAETSLPVIDCDGGGRAFPELQMYLPFIYGHPPFPGCISDDKGRVGAALFAKTPKDLEDYLRKICVEMGDLGAAVIAVLNPLEMMQKTVRYTLSRAWRLGLAVLQARATHSCPVTSILNKENGKLLITGKILEVNRGTTGGFDHGNIIVEGLEDFVGHVVLIDFQNENFIATSKDTKTILASTPDVITCVDNESGKPLPTEELQSGRRVSVIAIPSCPEMTSPEALRFVGPSAYGYDDVTYQPVGQFIAPKPVAP